MKVAVFLGVCAVLMYGNAVHGKCSKCSARANVQFIVDRSNSVIKGDADAKARVKQFLKDVFGGLDLGENAVVTSLIDFASNKDLKFSYADAASTDILLIEEKIDAINNPSGNSNIHKALDEAKDAVAPTTPSRSRACNVTVIMTDGQVENTGLFDSSLANYTAAVNPRFCIVEYRDRSLDTTEQKANRDRNLQEMKGDDGTIIGNAVYNNPRAVQSTVDCICNACSYECYD